MKVSCYTKRQAAALREYENPAIMYYLCEGGSRSGKTWSVCDNILKRAIIYPGTRHLICRQSKTACIATVWKQTLLEMLYGAKRMKGGIIVSAYPRNLWSEDKSNSIINFANKSSIWAGGFDNKQHEDAMLGSEWATIYPNEATDLMFEMFQKLRTRLNWLDVPLKLFADCNPKSPSHWLARLFHKHQDPQTGKKLSDKITSKMAILKFHPKDNLENLSPEYLEQLEGLTGLARKRFWDGEWAEDAEGLVYHAFDRKVNVVEKPIEAHPETETATMWDFGAADPTFIIVVQIIPVPKSPENPRGELINVIDSYTDKNKDAPYYAAWARSRPWFKYTNLRHYCDPSGKNRDAKLQSWVSILHGAGLPMIYTSAYTVDEMADCANGVIPSVRVCENQAPKVVEMFENWKYPTESDGTKKVGSIPNHDEYSHPGSAFYYFTCNRYGTKRARMIV